LKQEVKEAWEQYRLAQEKSAAREQELLEEINEYKKDRSQEKTALNQQFQQYQEEIDQVNNVLQEKEQEKTNFLTQISLLSQEKYSFQQTISHLQQELLDNQKNNYMGKQSVLDELTQALKQIEQMKLDHQSILTTLNRKIATLEKENDSLNVTVTENNKEIKKLNNAIFSYQQQQQQANESTSASSTGIGKSTPLADIALLSPIKGQSDTHQDNHAYLTRENYGLNKEIIQLSSQLEKEKETNLTAQQSLKILEKEYKNYSFQKENEISHLQETLKKLQIKLQEKEAKIKTLEEELQQKKEQSNDQEIDSSNSPGKRSSAYQQTLDALHDSKQQIDHLSKMLLKKQNDLLELTTERTALKGRVQDLQQR
jgi:chromosome segregation ATPase